MDPLKVPTVFLEGKSCIGSRKEVKRAIRNREIAIRHGKSSTKLLAQNNLLGSGESEKRLKANRALEL